MSSSLSLRALTWKSATADLNQTQDNPSRSHYKAIRPLLQARAFVSEPKKSHIRLYDKVPQSEPQTFSDSDDFESHLSVTPTPHTRIVSICCQSSLDPLGITETAMQKLTDLYEIDDSFIDHAVLFGDKPRTSDAGHGGITVKERVDGSFDMHYRFTYTGSYRVGVEGPTKFTDRQLCVFQRYSPSGTGNLWIFLHARPRTELQSKLEKTLATAPKDGLLDWAALHQLVFNTYIGNWRWCLRNFGEQIEAATDIALTMDLSNLKVVSDTESLGLLLHPQYLVNRIMPFSSQIGVTLATVRKMAEVNELFLSQGLTTDVQYRRLADVTAHYTSSLESYIKSVEALEKKVQGSSNLLATTLTLSNQARMLQLADASVEDNANVFVVTVVSLFYLPASFVSIFLGMNFFDFNSPEDGEFATSMKIWIFFLAALPLTCLTVGFWYFLTKHRGRARKRAKPRS
ncbi:uncharacterized protein BDV17DRAFT_255979 [Aspergillus undulatus]|uniref:uncharacterized protein n=1 Tax=Aspergillus undulatus TaxID=1810928 RepID=UPI003CCDAF75